MFDKYRANALTRLYMEKYTELKHLLELNEHPEVIKDEDLKVESLLNVYIEPTNRCNLSCTFCARENMGRNLDMLDMQSFRNIIDSLPEGSYITLTGHGEPTVNVRIYDMISYANRKGMFVSLITNASALNAENRKRLVDSGISRIQLSFQSLDKQTNERIMKGTVFQRELLHILKLICEIRKAKKNIYISISRVNIADSVGYAEITKRFWEKIPVDNYYEGELLSLQNESKMFHKTRENIQYLPCANPWITAQINADGNVTACALDWSAKYVLGNVKEQSLNAIQNSKEAIKFRRALLVGDWDYLENIGYGCCKDCNTWRKEVNGNIQGVMESSLPVRLGLVIHELSGDRPADTEFLERVIALLESGETDLIHTLMEGGI